MTTVAEFLAEHVNPMDRYSFEREGQFWSNQLSDYFPEVGVYIAQNKELDPFYQDQRLNAFWDALSKIDIRDARNILGEPKWPFDETN